MVETFRRVECCICKSTDLTHYEKVENFPVYMGVTKKASDEDLFIDQNWGICKSCGLLQLLELLPLDFLYSENHHTEAVGETWNSHHAEFAKFIGETTSKEVLEIGGAHGVLARLLLEKRGDLKYTFVEPSPGILPKECKVVTGYIEDNFELLRNMDSVIHSHVLEHIYAPADFISSVASRMKPNSKMYISFPNIEQLLLAGGTNSLNFEHTYFLTPTQLRVLSSNTGLELSREMEFRKHSFFWELTKIDSSPELIEFPNIQIKNELFKSLWQSLAEFVVECNIKLVNRKVPTFIFGAHVFSQGLIALGLNVESIEGILDNAFEKQNNRLYGTELQVLNPTSIANLPSVRVILRATHYQEEVRSQLKRINPAVEIIE